jgi:hypothetical protein
MEAERRHFVRKIISIHPVLACCRQSSRCGTVKDISLDGLKVVYHLPPSGPPDWRLLDFFAHGDRKPLFMSVPCRVIYNLPQLSEGETFTGTVSRMVGLQFQNLTVDQHIRIKSFLKFTSPDEPSAP